MKPTVSVVVPAYNESRGIARLNEALCYALADTSAEIVVVDDGSTDDTAAEIGKYAIFRVVSIARSGKSAALRAGIEAARSDVIVMIDADLQEDPSRIPDFVQQLRDGADLVTGVRVGRVDGFWTKRLPSRVYNFLMRRIFHTPFRDINCGFRAGRRELLMQLNWFEGCHRLLPVMVARRGGVVREIPVRHSPRIHGEAKFNSPGRFLPALADALRFRFGNPS
jgi:glycosyltransferase involved in cell wall biosynthesis